ncbi:BMP and activin membrane-bound inhibitor [Elysia marginata]|uniref:BMP and activin membrane-bound inhibitor n=1 Tax=Elysia marginata TaxID=1093978 RepID=A0AAV4G344_9GAST|nr:BMP and activin membrane-bound inhibitor [Elysia marginata]
MSGLFYLVGSSTSWCELRCHCNESGCVATGYMCKSRAGQCFTALEVRGEVTHLTHGCLDSVPEQRRALCQKLVDSTSSSAAQPGGSAANVAHEKASSNLEKSPSSETDVKSSSDGSSSSHSLSAGVHHHQPHLQQQQQLQHVQNPSAPMLLCCTEHMCNYREDADITVNLMPMLNSTNQRGKPHTL